MTQHFVPAKPGPTSAGPALSLVCQPPIGAFRYQVLQVDQHVTVVDPPITLKSLQPVTGKLGAEAAVFNVFFLGTGADPAPGTARMDVQNVGAAPLTGKTLQLASLAGCFLEEMLALGKRSAMVIACAAIETART